MHKHHIIPKHAGGTDHPDNLVLLTIEEHAEAHRLLYEEHNRWQDLLAWQMLSGQISKEEGIRFAQKNADKSWMKTDEGRAIMRAARKKQPSSWNKGLTKYDHQSLQDASDRAKLYQKQGKISSIGDHWRGKMFGEDHKRKLSDAAKNRKKVRCEHCFKEVIPQMYSRWHGDKCAQASNYSTY